MVSILRRANTMSFVLNPWQLYIGILVGWVNRQQHEAIAYLCTDNQPAADLDVRHTAPLPFAIRLDETRNGQRTRVVHF